MKNVDQSNYHKREVLADFFAKNSKRLKQGGILLSAFPDSKNPDSMVQKRFHNDRFMLDNEFDGVIQELKDLKNEIETFVQEVEKI